MTTVNYQGTNHDVDELVKAARHIQQLIVTLEAAQYQSRNLTHEFDGIGDDVRRYLDDQISDLRYEIKEIEDVIGKIQYAPTNHVALAGVIDGFQNPKQRAA